MFFKSQWVNTIHINIVFALSNQYSIIFLVKFKISSSLLWHCMITNSHISFIFSMSWNLRNVVSVTHTIIPMNMLIHVFDFSTGKIYLLPHKLKKFVLLLLLWHCMVTNSHKSIFFVMIKFTRKTISKQHNLRSWYFIYVSKGPGGKRKKFWPYWVFF